jgi:hypothetical protein
MDQVYCWDEALYVLIVLGAAKHSPYIYVLANAYSYSGIVQKTTHNQLVVQTARLGG